MAVAVAVGFRDPDAKVSASMLRRHGKMIEVVRKRQETGQPVVLGHAHTHTHTHTSVKSRESNHRKGRNNHQRNTAIRRVTPVHVVYVIPLTMRFSTHGTPCGRRVTF